MIKTILIVLTVLGFCLIFTDEKVKNFFHKRKEKRNNKIPVNSIVGCCQKRILHVKYTYLDPNDKICSITMLKKPGIKAHAWVGHCGVFYEVFCEEPNKNYFLNPKNGTIRLDSNHSVPLHRILDIQTEWGEKVLVTAAYNIKRKKLHLDDDIFFVD